MNKTKKIIYRVVTAWLALGMVSTAIAQLLKQPNGAGSVSSITHLGYPVYLLNIIAFWKIAGAIVILIPGYRLAKEWAWAGFFFLMSGALVSHLVLHDSFADTIPSALLLAIAIASRLLRPAVEVPVVQPN